MNLRRLWQSFPNLRRLVRFGLVGVVNTAVYYGFYLLLHMVLVYLVAHVIAFTLAMIISYFLNCRFTFHVRPHWRTFLLFPLSNLANFVITTVGLQVAVGGLGMNSKYAPLVVAVIAIPITYVVAHYIMLGKRHRLFGRDRSGQTGFSSERIDAPAGMDAPMDAP